MKKIGLICLALVLALGALGIGYAQWTETLLIDGTVNTGSVSAELSVGACSDNEVSPYTEVSSISCKLKVDDPKTLVVTVLNAYPSITYTCLFDITNTGTVPLKIASMNITGVPPEVEVVIADVVVGQVIDVGSVYGMITVHLTGDAPEGGVIIFTVPIELVLYNAVQ